MSDADDAIQDLAEQLVGLLQVLDPVREATLGYRQQFINHGMTAGQADRIAADFHHYLLSQVSGAQK